MNYCDYHPGCTPEEVSISGGRHVCERQDLLQQDFLTITHTDDRPACAAHMRQAISREPGTRQVEMRYFHRDGRLIFARLGLSAVHDSNGQPLYLIVQLEDVTQRRQMERLKNEFVSTVSHELRTPLTSIRGSLGLLGQSTLKRG